MRKLHRRTGKVNGPTVSGSSPRPAAVAARGFSLRRQGEEQRVRPSRVGGPWRGRQEQGEGGGGGRAESEPPALGLGEAAG